MKIQGNLDSTIAMAFDECVENPAPESMSRQARSVRCGGRPGAKHPSKRGSSSFGINQGGTYPDIRIENAKRLARWGLTATPSADLPSASLPM